LRKVRIAITGSTQVSMKESLSEGWQFIKTVPAFAYLALGMLAAGIVMTVLLFDTLSDAKLELGKGFQSFYAQYNLIIAIVSVFVQGISAKVIERLTLKRSFLIHPFIMIGTTVLNFLIPGYMSSAVSQGLSRVTYDTVDLSARKSFQAMVPNEKRGRVSMFIDSYLPSAGTIIGSLITFAIISIGLRIGIARDQYTLIYIGVGVLIAFVALFAAFKVRSTYEQSMLNWQLKRRTRGASVLDRLDFGGDDK
jgi:ATP:ADP antiporter, AAA family